MRQRHSGITLIELLLVVAIIAAVTAALGLQYRQQQWQKQVKQLKTSLTLMKQAANLYFYAHAIQHTTAIPYQQVVAMLPPALRSSIINPWALQPQTPFQVKVIFPASAKHEGRQDQPATRLVITSQFDLNPHAVQGFAQRLNGQYRAPRQVQWQFLPDQLPEPINSHLWIQSQFTHAYFQSVPIHTTQ